MAPARTRKRKAPKASPTTKKRSLRVPADAELPDNEPREDSQDLQEQEESMEVSTETASCVAELVDGEPSQSIGLDGGEIYSEKIVMENVNKNQMLEIGSRCIEVTKKKEDGDVDVGARLATETSGAANSNNPDFDTVTKTKLETIEKSGNTDHCLLTTATNKEITTETHCIDHTIDKALLRFFSASQPVTSTRKQDMEAWSHDKGGKKFRPPPRKPSGDDLDSLNVEVYNQSPRRNALLSPDEVDKDKNAKLNVCEADMGFTSCTIKSKVGTNDKNACQTNSAPGSVVKRTTSCIKDTTESPFEHESSTANLNKTATCERDDVLSLSQGFNMNEQHPKRNCNPCSVAPGDEKEDVETNHKDNKKTTNKLSSSNKLGVTNQQEMIEEVVESITCETKCQPLSQANTSRHHWTPSEHITNSEAQGEEVLEELQSLNDGCSEEVCDAQHSPEVPVMQTQGFSVEHFKSSNLTSEVNGENFDESEDDGDDQYKTPCHSPVTKSNREVMGEGSRFGPGSNLNDTMASVVKRLSFSPMFDNNSVSPPKMACRRVEETPVKTPSQRSPILGIEKLLCDPEVIDANDGCDTMDIEGALKTDADKSELKDSAGFTSVCDMPILNPKNQASFCKKDDKLKMSQGFQVNGQLPVIGSNPCSQAQVDKMDGEEIRCQQEKNKPNNNTRDNVLSLSQGFKMLNAQNSTRDGKPSSQVDTTVGLAQTIHAQVSMEGSKTLVQEGVSQLANLGGFCEDYLRDQLDDNLDKNIFNKADGFDQIAKCNEDGKDSDRQITLTNGSKGADATSVERQRIELEGTLSSTCATLCPSHLFLAGLSEMKTISDDKTRHPTSDSTVRLGDEPLNSSGQSEEKTEKTNQHKAQLATNTIQGTIFSHDRDETENNASLGNEPCMIPSGVKAQNLKTDLTKQPLDNLLGDIEPSIADMDFCDFESDMQDFQLEIDTFAQEEEIDQFEKDFQKNQASTVEQLNKSKSDGSSHVRSILNDLMFMNRQMMKMKREMDVVSRNLAKAGKQNGNKTPFSSGAKGGNGRGRGR